MKLPIASLREIIYTSIMYSRVNISRCGLLPGTTSSVAAFFSVSRSHLLNIIAGGGITLNSLCGPKGKDATAPHIREKMHNGIFFSRENGLKER